MILSGLFCVVPERTDMNENALSDDSNTAYKMIDCIHFAKLSLYSVNTAPVCKICRLSRTVKKNNRMMLEYLYWISFYCTWGGRWLCWIHCSYDKSSKDKVLRFKWETPLLVFVCFLVTMFSHCRKCQVFMCYILYVVYIDYTRQFRLILLYVFILKIFFLPTLREHCHIHVVSYGGPKVTKCSKRISGKSEMQYNNQ